MKVSIADREEFSRCFLKPISNFNTLAKITFGDAIESVVASTDATCILFAQYNSSNPDGPKAIAVNVPKFISSVECVDSEMFTLQLEPNSIQYKSSGVRWKLHTLDLSVVANLPINKDRLNSLSYNAKFTITPLEVRRLVKSSTFVEANKLYIQSDEKDVYVTLTDKAIDNTDSFALKLDSETNEEFSVVPINFEVIRQLASLPADEDTIYHIRISAERVVEISVERGKYSLKYILAPYQK